MKSSKSGAIIAALVTMCAHLTGCPDPTQTLTEIPCPSVTFGLNVIYQLNGELEFGQTAEGTLHPSSFAGNSFGAPAESTVSISVTLVSKKQIPVVFIYGPRQPDGSFGLCNEKGGQKGAGKTVNIQFEVEPGDGGEYLVLIATNPLKAATGTYEITVKCQGQGCEKPICPLATCPQEICPSGFLFDDKDCQTCECKPTECGPFKKLVFGECVCDCDGPEEPVCGVNGVTYSSPCIADCEEIPFVNFGTCDALCPPLVDCDKECSNGFQMQAGCQICECQEDPCFDPLSRYRPVCGTDGLSYSNRGRMKCLSSSLEVAYVGPCLPYCTVPQDCDKTCEWGLMVKPGLGTDCFNCECMEADTAGPNGLSCETGQNQLPKFVCASKLDFVTINPVPVEPNGDAGNQPGGGQAKIPNSQHPYPSLKGSAKAFVDAGPLTRTFVNKCKAKNSEWTVLAAVACPTGMCRTSSDCSEAASMLGVPLISDDTTVAPDKWAMHCVKVANYPHLNGVCRLRQPQACLLKDAPSPETADDCSEAEACFYLPDGPGCNAPSTCQCSKNPASRIYNPVCVTSGTEHITYYNECMAFCAHKGSITHPGVCCEVDPKSSSAVMNTYIDWNAVCKAADPLSNAKISLVTACPVPATECQESGNGGTTQCCTDAPTQ